MRKAPTLRNNNGALQVRVRLDGKDHFINCLGRFEDPVARARAQAISAEIWRDYQHGQLDWSLCRYKPLVEGKDPDLLKALEALTERKRQGRTTHTYRVVRRYGGALRNNAEGLPIPTALPEPCPVLVPLRRTSQLLMPSATPVCSESFYHLWGAKSEFLGCWLRRLTDHCPCALWD